MADAIELLLHLFVYWRLGLGVLASLALGWLTSGHFPIATGFMACAPLFFGLTWEDSKAARGQPWKASVRRPFAFAILALLGAAVGLGAMGLSASMLGGLLGIAGALTGAAACQH